MMNNKQSVEHHKHAKIFSLRRQQSGLWNRFFGV